MRRILNNNLLRQLKVIELIIFYDGQTLFELKQSVSVNEKTIKMDILAINSIISPLRILTKESGGYVIECTDRYDRNYIYSCFLETSLEFQILELIMADETLIYSELADSVFISVSTLRRSLTRMNDILADYEIQILSNPVRLRGNEDNIINFFQNYLKEKYTVTDRFLKEFESMLVDEMLKELLPQFNQTWTFTKSERVKWLIKMNAIRIKNGNYNSLKIEEELENGEACKGIIKYRERFKSVFNLSLTKNLLELLISAKPSKLPGEGVSIKDQAAQENAEIEVMLTKIGDEFNIKNTNRKALALELYKMSESNHDEIFILKDPNIDFIYSLKSDRPLFFNFLVNCYTRYKHILGKNTFSTFSFIMMTEWDELYKKVSRKRSKVKIGLFFSTTNKHIEVMKEEFKGRWNEGTSLLNLNHLTISMLDQSEVDIIITNISNLPTTKECVCVSDYPVESDIKKIMTIYEQWTSVKR